MAFLWELIKGIGTLATGILFLLEGISFGYINISGCIEQYTENPQLFVIQYARGFSFVSFVYFVIVVIISMINGFNDVFIIIFGGLAMATAVATVTVIGQHYDWWSLVLYISGFPLIIKLTHTAYFTINEVLKEDTNYDIYSYLITSLIFECLLLLGWSLWPFLSLKSKEQSIPLTVWSLEFGDVVSHLAVCLFYANVIGPINHWDNSPILQSYFAFWIINLYLWAVPLYPMIHFINYEKDGAHVVLGIHIMVIDFLTDLPILIITLSGRTYVNNPYIAFDIALKIILFIRGCVWTPIVVFGDRFEPQSFVDGWDFTITQAKSSSTRSRRHSV